MDWIGNESEARDISVTIETTPTAPKNVKVSGDNAVATITFEKPDTGNANKYFIYRKTTGSRYEKIGEVDATKTLSYVDEKVTVAKKYYYYVHSVGQFELGTDSNEVLVTIGKDTEAPTITDSQLTVDNYPLSNNIVNNNVRIDCCIKDNIKPQKLIISYKKSNEDTWNEYYKQTEMEEVNNSQAIIYQISTLKKYFVGVYWDTEKLSGEYDLKIGVKSTAILFGQHDISIISTLQASSILLIGAALWLENLLIPFGLLALLLVAADFIYQWFKTRDKNPQLCFWAFRHNRWIGLIIFVGILFALR